MRTPSFGSIQRGRTRIGSGHVFPAAVLVLTLLCCFASRGQDDAPVSSADVPPILKIGAHAPDFNLKGVDGKMHSLADYASSKVLVVVFNCDHCPIASMYEKRIK